MAPLKLKGTIAELAVAVDLARRGYDLAIPYGEDTNYDLVLDRGTALERIQVKHSRSNGKVLPVKCYSASLTNGKVRVIKKYDATMIDWLAIYDATTGWCYYVPAALLGTGMAMLHLRVGPTANNQAARIRWASDFTEI